MLAQYRATGQAPSPPRYSENHSWTDEVKRFGKSGETYREELQAMRIKYLQHWPKKAVGKMNEETACSRPQADSELWLKVTAESDQQSAREIINSVSANENEDYLERIRLFDTITDHEYDNVNYVEIYKHYGLDPRNQLWRRFLGSFWSRTKSSRSTSWTNKKKACTEVGCWQTFRVSECKG